MSSSNEPDITRAVNPKGSRTASDLEDKMEKILEPLDMAVEAAYDALKLHAGPDQLSVAVADIVGDAVATSYSTAHEKLIELARITVGDAAKVPPVGRGGA